jgi:hypothetical protein
MTHCSHGWQGIKFSALQTVQNLLEALLNSEIPVKKHLYKEVIFVQQNVANYKLTKRITIIDKVPGEMRRMYKWTK